MATKQERFWKACHDFEAKMVRGGTSAEVAQSIIKDAGVVAAWDLRYCNGDVEAESVKDPATGEWRDTGRWVRVYNINGPGPIRYAPVAATGPRAEERIRATIARLGAGWAVEMSGDPRGAAVKVRIPGVPGDSWGGEGFTVVPQRDAY